MKTSFRIVLAIIAIAFCCCEKDPTFRVIALDNTKITATSTATTAKITYNATLLEDGKYENGIISIMSCYLRYSDRPATSFNNMTYYNTQDQEIRYAGPYSFLLEDLRPNTTYYYALRFGDMYSAVKTFKTTIGTVTVETGTATNITASTAKLSGKCTLNGATLQEAGVLIHTSSSMSYTNYTKRYYGTYLDFVANVTDLVGNTTYYCAYAKDTEGNLYYGDVKNFKTVNQPIRSAKTAVDLGLSVKWAAGNVGATNESDYGNLYAWGETSTKSVYNWSTYKYCKGSRTTLTKYCTSSSHGVVDNKTVLDPVDDAAHVNWGGNWRMPTEAEQDELMNKCTWTWTRNYNGTGAAGYIVSSKKNSNSIFLPASGWRLDEEINGVGSLGNYWSSSLFVGSVDYAYNLDFNSDRVGYSDGASLTCRDWGYSVRPVCP